MSYPLPPKPEKPPKPPRSGYQKLFHFSFWFLVVVACGACAVFFVISSISGKDERQKSIVESIITGVVNNPVQVGKLHQFSLAPDIIYHFEKLTASGDLDTFKIDQFSLHTTLWSVLISDPIFKELNMAGAYFPAPFFFKKDLTIKEIDVVPLQKGTAELSASGQLGKQKFQLTVGLNAYVDTMSKPYYKLPKTMPIHVVIGDLDISGSFERGAKSTIKDFVAFRISKPQDKVTGHIDWQRKKENIILQVQMKSDQSDLNLDLDFTKYAGMLKAAQINWDEFFGVSTLSLLRQRTADFAPQSPMTIDFQLAPDFVVTCNPSASLQPPQLEIHEKILQNCFNQAK